MTYRILVATDFSPGSDFALRHALTILGRIAGSELHLVHVVVDPALHAKLDRDARLLDDSLERLRAGVRAITESSEGERTERAVVHHVRLGRSAARAIEEVARDVAADLVVVGSHARRGLERLVLGSVAEDLLRSGRVALLVARPNVWDGMEPQAKIEPPKPGVNVRAKRYDLVESSERIVWHHRPSHIAGLL
jgi:nucleotide-binding universal stress UspA family protein